MHWYLSRVLLIHILQGLNHNHRSVLCTLERYCLLLFCSSCLGLFLHWFLKIFQDSSCISIHLSDFDVLNRDPWLCVFWDCFLCMNCSQYRMQVLPLVVSLQDARYFYLENNWIDDLFLDQTRFYVQCPRNLNLEVNLRIINTYIEHVTAILNWECAGRTDDHHSKRLAVVTVMCTMSLLDEWISIIASRLDHRDKIGCSSQD